MKLRGKIAQVKMMKKSLASIVSLIFFLFSCSKIELTDDWVDSYIASQIDNYFDINSLQMQLLKKSIKEDLGEVRSIIFPQLADELKSIRKDVEIIKEYKIENVTSHQVELKKIFNQGLIIFEPSAQHFVNRLNSTQIESFQKEFNKRTKDIESSAEHLFEAKAKRYEKIKDQLEGWLGPLNLGQIKAIEKFCNEYPIPAKAMVLNRNKLLRDFLSSFPKKEERSKFVQKLFYEYESLRDESYGKAIEFDRQKYYELITSILNLMSPDQKKYLMTTLKERIDQVHNASKSKRSDLF